MGTDSHLINALLEVAFQRLFRGPRAVSAGSGCVQMPRLLGVFSKARDDQRQKEPECPTYERYMKFIFLTAYGKS